MKLLDTLAKILRPSHEDLLIEVDKRVSEVQRNRAKLLGSNDPVGEAASQVAETFR
jgi:hypothetical protein